MASEQHTSVDRKRFKLSLRLFLNEMAPAKHLYILEGERLSLQSKQPWYRLCRRLTVVDLRLAVTYDLAVLVSDSLPSHSAPCSALADLAVVAVLAVRPVLLLLLLEHGRTDKRV